MANTQLQALHEQIDGQTSDNGERLKENMDEDIDSDMNDYGYTDESMVIHPLSFIFCQITQSQPEAAMRKLGHLGGQGIHHSVF